jgi:O-acetylserine/cysteine efflux transporter
MPVRHVLLALVVVVVWGVNFVVIDAGLHDIPPLLFVALRFTLVAFPAILIVPRPRMRWPWVVGIGATMSLGQFALLYVALALGMPAGLASLVLQAQVLLTVAISAIALREPPTPRQLVGMGVGVVGLVIVGLGHGLQSGLAPLLVTIGAAASWAVGNVLSRRAGRTVGTAPADPGGRATPASGIRSALSLVVWSAPVVPIPTLALAFAIDGPDAVVAGLRSIGPGAILSTLYTVVVATLAGYAIWNSLLARHAAARVVPFALLIPVVGILTAWLVAHETPAPLELLGGGVMIAGLAVAVVPWAALRIRPGAVRA